MAENHLTYNCVAWDILVLQVLSEPFLHDCDFLFPLLRRWTCNLSLTGHREDLGKTKSFVTLTTPTQGCLVVLAQNPQKIMVAMANIVQILNFILFCLCLGTPRDSIKVRFICKEHRYIYHGPAVFAIPLLQRACVGHTKIGLWPTGPWERGWSPTCTNKLWALLELINWFYQLG